ncbi:hypothetical protein CFP65_4568 [Kitasatospora sp. MMS16-BH015]|nr:hypothetical protein CFP65_4568 [Kitasatospora sp. MMS16-BH015]
MRGGRCAHPIETPVRPAPLKIETTTATQDMVRVIDYRAGSCQVISQRVLCSR